MLSLNDRISIDNSKQAVNTSHVVKIADISDVNDINLRIDNSKQSADHFRSISLQEIKDILNNESNDNFNLNTHLVIDNNKNAFNLEKAFKVEDVLEIVGSG